jgi:hypothetical protein
LILVCWIWIWISVETNADPKHLVLRFLLFFSFASILAFAGAGAAVVGVFDNAESLTSLVAACVRSAAAGNGTVAGVPAVSN